MLDETALSALVWWEEAGVDTLVEDKPRNWLAPAHTTDAPAMPAAALPATTLPRELAAFRAWLLADAAVPGAPSGRIDAAGDPASGTMIVVDMPEAADRAARILLGGEAGALFDKMLAAMGLARGGLYLAPLAPARPASGKLDAEQSVVLTRLIRHHVALAAPRRLLLLGDAAIHALLGQTCAAARGTVHALAYDGGTTQAVASFHPRFLVQTPARKAAAWADLQLFMAL